jgi:hypothetical protein
VRLALQAKASVDRRFDSRGAIWTFGEDFGVISRVKTERQKFQRAFAQSLFCTFPDLRRQIDLTGPSEEEVFDAARYFRSVPASFRRRWYSGVLPRETLEQRLEAA